MLIRDEIAEVPLQGSGAGEHYPKVEVLGEIVGGACEGESGEG